MDTDELYVRLSLADDATAEIILLFKEVDWPTTLATLAPLPKPTLRQKAAWEAAREAASSAARGAARDAARDTAWEAASSAAWGAAREAARGAVREVAWEAALDAANLAGCMVVQDLLDKKHMDAMLACACRWLGYRR